MTHPLRPVLAAALILLLSPGLGSAAEVTVIHAGTLLAVPGQAPLTEQSIIVRGGRISEIRDGYVDPDSVVAPGETALQVDLSDAFVLPGLIDLHTHLLGELGPQSKLESVTMSAADRALAGALYARRTLEAGFTTVRNTGGDPEAIFALRRAVAAGHVVGPRIVAAGAGISATGGHGDAHGFATPVLDVLQSPGICNGADDCRRAVRENIKRGSDLIKITATGGVLSETAAGTAQQLTDDELTAIVETAHGLGRKVAAHAHGADGINAALRAGVDSIEHGTFGDEESFELYRQTGAYLVPTMLAGATVYEMATEQSFMPPAIREKAIAVGPQMAAMVEKAWAAGVKIAFGTDSGVSRHGDNAREFQLMVDAGIPPAAAIATATVHAAELIGLSAEIGTLEPGKAADLIATAGSPLDDVTELERVVWVMRTGVVHRGDG